MTKQRQLPNHSNPLRCFDGKYAVITGDAQGISIAVVDRMAAEWLAGVVLTDLNGEQVAESVATIARRYDCEAYGVTSDLSKSESGEALFRFVHKTLLRLGIPLINGAGPAALVEIDSDK